MRKQILDNQKTQEVVKGMLKRNVNATETQVNEVYQALYDVQSPQFNMEIDGIAFENTLHYDEENNRYLLESRLFDDKRGAMIDALLLVYNADGTLYEEEVFDDVWVFDWKVVK